MAEVDWNEIDRQAREVSAQNRAQAEWAAKVKKVDALVEKALKRSASSSARIVKIKVAERHLAEAAYSQLYCLSTSADWLNNGDVKECWGVTGGGQDWRVHICFGAAA